MRKSASGQLLPNVTGTCPENLALSEERRAFQALKGPRFAGPSHHRQACLVATRRGWNKGSTSPRRQPAPSRRAERPIRRPKKSVVIHRKATAWLAAAVLTSNAIHDREHAAVRRKRCSAKWSAESNNAGSAIRRSSARQDLDDDGECPVTPET